MQSRMVFVGSFWVLCCAVGFSMWSPQAHALGLLVPTQESLPPLAVQSHRVQIDVTDQAAVTKVEQVFVNSTNRPLEATFYFPVPKGATVSNFSLWINGVKTQGAVLERAQARQTYEGIVRRIEDPGLVEYIDGSIFQARIFPVPAKGTQKVEISFASVLEQSQGMRKLVYPLRTGRHTAKLLQDLTITANISSSIPLKAMYSPTHQIHTRRKGDFKALVGLEETRADLERDFVLYMGTSKEDVGVSLLTWDPDGKGGEDGYFLMVLTPKMAVKEEDIAPKTVTFVVDTSGSMNKDGKIKQAQDALRSALAKLRPVDRFNIIRFSTDVEPLFTTPQPAQGEPLARGRAFVDRFVAAGGTAISEALDVALDTPKSSIQGSHYVLFLTDGRPTVGETQIHTILNNTKKKRSKDARIFTFGVGYEVNTTLLDQLSAQGSGVSEYVRPSEEIESKVAALNNRIAYPVLSRIALDYGTQGVYDVYPRALPDLYRGGQVTVMGRTRSNLPSTIKLSGRMNGRDVGFAFREDAPHASARSNVHDFIPKLWATRKVGYLLEAIRAEGELGELKTEVIRLGKRYGLVTPYTSYLAVDDSEFNRPQPQPGWGGGGLPHRPTHSGPVLEERPTDMLQTEGDDVGGVFSSGGSVQKSRRRESILKRKGSMKADSGKDAVDTSIATRSLKEAESQEAAKTTRTRYVRGALFVHSSKRWVQDGAVEKGAVVVRAMSPAWFVLLKERPEVREALQLGRSVLLNVGRKTVWVHPSQGKTALSADEVRAW